MCVALLHSSGAWKIDTLSVHSGCWRRAVDAAALPAAVVSVLDELRVDPPVFGTPRIPRHPPMGVVPGLHTLQRWLVQCPLRRRHPAACVGDPQIAVPAFMATHVLRGAPEQRPLPADDTHLQLLSRWRVPTDSPGSCVVPFYAEKQINQWLRTHGSSGLTARTVPLTRARLLAPGSLCAAARRA